MALLDDGKYTVQTLIEELMKIEDKTKPVTNLGQYIYLVEEYSGNVDIR